MRVIKFLKKVYGLKATLGWLDFLIAYPIFLSQLFVILPKSRESNWIVVLCEGGFGHTVADVDMARRLFGPNGLFVILSEVGRHNRELAKIWVDVEVCHLLKSCRWRTDIHQIALTKTLTYLLNKDSKKRFVFFGDQYNNSRHAKRLQDYLLAEDVYASYLDIRAKSPDGSFQSYWYMPSWYRLMEYKYAPRPRLPYSWMAKLSGSPLGTQRKLICLYLRSKDHGDSESSLRNTEDLKEWEPVLDHFGRRGYSFLLTGDFGRKQFSVNVRKYLIDSHSVKLNRKKFYIAAVFQADFFVGDWGGGAYLPQVLDQPILTTNCLPFGTGPYKGFVLYKNIRVGSRDCNLGVEECLKRFNSSMSFPDDINMSSNNSRQLIVAIEELVECNVDRSVLQSRSEFDYTSWAHAAKTRLSKANDV